MAIQRKLFVLLMVLFVTTLLVACGNEESAEGIQAEEGSVVGSDGPQDINPDDVLPLSEAFEEYSVWFEAGRNPTRKSDINTIYVFKNGEVTKHEKKVKDESGNINWNSVDLEDLLDLSNDEIVQLFSIEESEIHEFGEYILDIEIDEYGQNTRSIVLETQKTKDAEEADDRWSPYESVDIFPEQIGVTLFDTAISGFITSYNTQSVATESLITRVDNSSSPILFKLDGPDTDKKNVTVEGE